MWIYKIFKDANNEVRFENQRIIAVNIEQNLFVDHINQQVCNTDNSINNTKINERPLNSKSTNIRARPIWKNKESSITDSDSTDLSNFNDLAAPH